jgi:hypothetical protein
MQTANLQQLRENTASVIAAAQTADMLVIEEGKMIAVVSRPRVAIDFAQYWIDRERSLELVVAEPGWDSASAVSHDRDRA